MKRVGIAISVLMIVCILPAQAQDAGLGASLRARDQALLDAIPRGNRVVWEKELASEFIYVSEDGHVLDRAGLLRLLVPTSPYDELPMQIREHTVYVIGDTAIVIHRADETGTHLGSKLTGEYLTTETWQRADGEWKLRSVHVEAVPTSPLAVDLTAAQLDEVVGTYGAEAVTYTVRREGSRLFAKPSDGEEREWKAETRDTFFQADRPRQRVVLRRDTAGKITGFSWRNENRSVAYARID